MCNQHNTTSKQQVAVRDMRAFQSGGCWGPWRSRHPEEPIMWVCHRIENREEQLKTKPSVMRIWTKWWSHQHLKEEREPDWSRSVINGGCESLRLRRRVSSLKERLDNIEQEGSASKLKDYNSNHPFTMKSSRGNPAMRVLSFEIGKLWLHRWRGRSHQPNQWHCLAMRLQSDTKPFPPCYEKLPETSIKPQRYPLLATSIN